MAAPVISCSISYRPDLQLLVVRWPADAAVPQLQTDFEAILQAALAHGTGRWLLDVRRRNDLQPEFAHWTVHDFFPRAAVRLAAVPLRIGTLCSPARLAVYNSSAEQKSILETGMALGQQYHLRLFLEEGAVMEWLQQ